MIQRNERLSKGIRGDDDTPNGEVESPKAESATEDSSKKESNSKEKPSTNTTENENSSSNSTNDKEQTREKSKSEPKEKPSIDKQVQDWNAQLVKENKNLHRLN